MVDHSRTKIRAIDSLWTFFIAVAFVGPLALPLLWRNPRFSARTKVLGSLAVVLLTLFLFWFLGRTLQLLYDRINEMKAMLE